MNMTWIFFAVGNAIISSVYQALNNFAASTGRFSKFTIAFFGTAITSPILFFFSYIHGFPKIGGGFWTAVFVTGILNFIATPIMLKAYETGEFSSVYSMILLTPVFLVVTSYFFLGEKASILGILGIALTVFGLWFLAKPKAEGHKEKFHYFKGPALGIVVALIYSISINFDKLTVKRSDALFASAVVLGLLGILNGIYLLTKYRGFGGARNFGFSNLLILVPIGVSLALTQFLQNSAFLLGLASYTIAIKRTGILFGVLWGWLFFKEDGFKKKFFGAALAVLGVVTLLFA